jgi:cell division control protein 6
MAFNFKDKVSFPNSDIEAALLQRLRPNPFQKGDLDILSDKSTPPRIVHRDKEVGKVIDVVSSAILHAQPSHLFAFGKSGTGKTAVVRHVVEAAGKVTHANKKTLGLFVNCTNQVSHHALLIRLIEQLEGGEHVPSNTAAGELHDRLLQACKKTGANIVVVLDEVNHLVKRSGVDAMYSIANLNAELEGDRATISIIAISNDLHFGEKLPASVQSRLAAEKLYFAPYSAEQLRDILRDRADLVFNPDGLDVGLIELCAAYAAQAHGDARQALALLRKAAVIAGREGARKVMAHHVVSARGALEYDVIADGVRRLTAHEKIVLLVIAHMALRRSPGDNMNIGRVYEEYQHVCNQIGLSPLVSRSVGRCLADLSDQGFVRTEVKSLGRAKGRTTLVQITVPPESTVNIIQEDSLFDRAPGVPPDKDPQARSGHEGA